MTMTEFCRVLTTFADSPADIDVARGRLVVQVRDEVIEATVRQQAGALVVSEGGVDIPAPLWLVNRVAHVPQLADRILSFIDEATPFVTPSGRLLDQVDYANEDTPIGVADAVASIREILGRRPAGTSSILYLTSDAGEGKTTVINHAARQQAKAYKNKQSDWLLLPITLGGRPFLRFDDVVIGALVNRLRFPFFYYDAFIELVRMGVVVPAFDGFEEMFVESSSGEALSALGTLLRTLDSAGTVLIAARKAYFEFKSLETRSKLFDAISADSVAFARLRLERWTRKQFIDYARMRHVPSGEELHERVAARLGSPDHPVLTRAVLVKRLMDVATDVGTLDALLVQLGQTPHDYFHQFVHAIVEREVREKWIDRSGQPARPLLTVHEHYELLAMVAHEMWLGSSEALRVDMLDVIVDLFAESRGKNAVITRQVKERLPQHSLISTAEQQRFLFGFDHEDFRKFFLGEALGRALVAAEMGELRAMLRVGTLPADTCDAAAYYAQRTTTPGSDIVKRLQAIGQSDLPSSFTRENAGALMMRLLDGEDTAVEPIRELAFPAQALRGRNLRGVRFESCYFQATSLDGTALDNVEFTECSFDGIELSTSLHIRNVRLSAYDVKFVLRAGGDVRTYDPEGIKRLLAACGFSVGAVPAETTRDVPADYDEEMELVERMLRVFLRSTFLNESALRTRLGSRGNQFFDDILPELLVANVLEEVMYAGSGRQRRFRLAMPMGNIEEAVARSRGSFRNFLEVLR